MKRLLLVAMLLGGLSVGNLCLGLNKANALPVEFDLQDFYDWGRLYSYDGANYTPTNVNPWNPGGINEPAVVIPHNTTGNFDTHEDSWGIIQIDQIQTLPPGPGSTTLFDKTLDPYELTVFFSGFDDDAIGSPDFLGNSAIGAVGGHMQIWKDFAQDFDPNLGTAGRTGNMAYTGATEGELVLDLTPVVQNGFGHTFLSSFNFGNNTGGGSVYFDVTGGSWAATYDTNTQLFGSDIFITWTARDNINPTVGDWIVRADGRMEADTVVPEPTTVVLLGIGLVGMAGVTVRKKLKKNVVEKS